MRAVAFIVICHFVNDFSCAETSNQFKTDSRIGVCPELEKVNGIHKPVDKCCKGYMRLLNSDSFACIPKCGKNDCTNGKCIAPDVCTCDDGYELKKDSLYECHEKCKNGYVRDPETEKCQCGLHCAEIEGICECLHKDQRIHGLLIQNDTSSLCTDNDGTSSKTCSCLNGFYTSNGTCVCANGYKMRDGFVDLCEPQCENECVGGVCIEPNECQCENGYELGHNKNETNICYPICKSNIDGINGCGNGTCIAPNTCKCDYGFENHVKGNYACTASALTAERQKAETNWVIPGVLLTLVVLATFLGGGFFIRKRKMNSSETASKKNDTISDRFNIEVYSLEDF